MRKISSFGVITNLSFGFNAFVHMSGPHHFPGEPTSSFFESVLHSGRLVLLLGLNARFHHLKTPFHSMQVFIRKVLIGLIPAAA